VSLITLKRLDLFKGALPSKMFEAMAAAIPVVVAVDGEARALVEAAQAGICVEPENPRAMAEAISRLQKDPQSRKQLGQNGRRFVVDHFDRKQIAKKLDHLLMEICRSGTHRQQDS
jgi:glycosyltransferase involved in cell wall biosynthesis